MKIYTTQGIVFRKMKYSETSIIADIYTLDKGLRSYIIGGVRKSKARVSAAMFDHMNIVEVTAYDSKEDKLARIKEIHLDHIYTKLTSDVVKSSLGIFLLEITRDCIKEREPNESLYQFIKDWFVYLDACEHQVSCFHLMYLLGLSVYLGFAPMNNYDEEQSNQFDLMDGCFVNGAMSTSKYLLPLERSIFIRQLLSSSKEQLQYIRIPKEIRDDLLEDIIKFYRLHSDNFKEPKSLGVVRVILG